MSSLSFLDGYGGQSTDELIAMESRYRVDSIVLAFEEAIGRKETKVGLHSLTPQERCVLAVEALEREVNNGGFDQFFINQPEHASIIVDTLKRIDCPTAADIAQAAVEALGIDVLTTDAVEDAMSRDDDERIAKHDACDGRWYKLEEDIAGRLFTFIKANRNSISL